MGDEMLPRCMVKFTCPWVSADKGECDAEAVVNAYLGPPYHAHGGLRVAMKPVQLMVGEMLDDRTAITVTPITVDAPGDDKTDLPVQEQVIETVRYGTGEQ